MMREKYHKALLDHPLRGHSFISLSDCHTSNFFLATGITSAKDSLVKFTVLARTSSLHTGQVRRLASRDDEEDGLCGCGELESLAHILNGCRFLKQRYTDRHNRVVDLVWDMNSKANHPAQLHPHFNTVVPGPLSEATRRLRTHQNGEVHPKSRTWNLKGTKSRTWNLKGTRSPKRRENVSCKKDDRFVVNSLIYNGMGSSFAEKSSTKRKSF